MRTTFEKEANEAIEQYGWDEAVYVLADLWNTSTYRAEARMKELREYGYELFESDCFGDD